MEKVKRFHIGLRTLKTAAAVIISMVLVNAYGTTSSKLIFAMLGAMEAMEPTLKESLEACKTQILGVFFGAVIGVLLIQLPVSGLVLAGVGVVLVITLYNAFRIRFSPSLPCLIVVTVCTTPDIQPVIYAIGRFWDTAFGLGIGIFINAVIFPYDNSRRIRNTAAALEREVLLFMEKMFDGNHQIPDVENMHGMIGDLEKQLKIFSNQWSLLHLRKKDLDFEIYRIYERKAEQLVTQMEVLCQMQNLGALSPKNREILEKNGAVIKDATEWDAGREVDIVTNYHVTILLSLRQELLEMTLK